MERLSSHVSTAKATFSGRSAQPLIDSTPACRHASHQQIRGLQKALRKRLQPDLVAATSRLCSHGSAKTRKGKKSHAESIRGTLAEPPLEVLEETFPRGASWEVNVLPVVSQSNARVAVF